MRAALPRCLSKRPLTALRHPRLGSRQDEARHNFILGSVFSRKVAIAYQRVCYGVSVTSLPICLVEETPPPPPCARPGVPQAVNPESLRAGASADRLLVPDVRLERL